MDLNLLLKSKGIDPHEVIVMRHRPKEPKLAKVIGWLAAEKPELFNAYQQTQGAKEEAGLLRLVGKGYVASFIAHGAGRALFVGLYRIGATTTLTADDYWKVPAYVELKEFDMQGFVPKAGRKTILWFDMSLTEHFADWKGRLVIGWSPPERSWFRRAERNALPVIAINEESLLESEMPEWDAINLSWNELSLLPSKWRAALSHWRGIYFIFDVSDGKGYVGSAYGESNIYGRWSEYAASGHGGNKLLKKRDPLNFKFSILQRLSPDMDAKEVILLESSWKERLHTRQPFGLNEN
jgi:hypothetical protein